MRDLDPLDLDLTAQIYLRLGLILSVRLRSYGSGLLDARAAEGVAGARLPRRCFAGAGLSWPSGLHPGRGLALEIEHNAVNTSRCSRKLISARIRAPHGGGRHGVTVTRGTRSRRGEKG
jgi:hypothetical protein